MRAGGKFHYSIMLTTTLARNLTQLQMLSTCLFTKLHGRQYMFNKYFMVSSHQQQAVYITDISLLSHKNPENNHVILRIHWFTEIMEFSGLTIKPCGRWMGNRKSIWSDLIYAPSIIYV